MTLYEKRVLILETVNERDNITLSVNGRKYPAKVYGAKSDYPYIYTRNEQGQEIDGQITWQLCESLASGESDNVIF
jgi:hypothetical protein